MGESSYDSRYAMPTIDDNEFGTIIIRRSRLSTHVKLSVAPDGRLRISMPTRTPLLVASRLIATSRPSIRAMLKTSQPERYTAGMQIGKSHHLHVVSGSVLKLIKQGQALYVHLPENVPLSTPNVQALIRSHVRTALRKEAKSYLPRRLAFLAQKHGFSYASVRFSHASSRWGSCSSRGVISLNIALMKLSFEQIDYVLLHELAHTKQLNHSEKFWTTLAGVCPDYAVLRRSLKAVTPSI